MSNKALEELEAYVKLLRLHLDDKDYKPKFPAGEGAFDYIQYISDIAHLTPRYNIAKASVGMLMDAFIRSGAITKEIFRSSLEYVIPAFLYYQEGAKTHSIKNETKLNTIWLLDAFDWAKNNSPEVLSIFRETKAKVEAIDPKLERARANNSPDLLELLIKRRDIFVQCENAYLEIQIKYIEYLSSKNNVS